MTSEEVVEMEGVEPSSYTFPINFNELKFVAVTGFEPANDVWVSTVLPICLRCVCHFTIRPFCGQDRNPTCMELPKNFAYRLYRTPFSPRF